MLHYHIFCIYESQDWISVELQQGESGLSMPLKPKVEFPMLHNTYIKPESMICVPAMYKNSTH